MVLSEITGSVDEVVIDFHDIELRGQFLQRALRGSELLGRDSSEASRLRQRRPGLHARQADADETLGLVPDPAGGCCAGLIDKERDDGRCIEVGDH